MNSSISSNFMNTNDHLSNKVHTILQENNELKEKMKKMEDDMQ